MTNTYNIFVYKDLLPRKHLKADHVFVAKSKRQVVGLMKTIMDNFDPKHVDIIKIDK